MDDLWTNLLALPSPLPQVYVYVDHAQYVVEHASSWWPPSLGDILTFLVAAGTLLLAGFTWRLARGTAVLAREAHASSRAADRLYDLQREELERRERIERPNLQIVDVRQPEKDAGKFVHDLLIDLRNFGRRSLRVVRIEFVVNDKRLTAEQRSRPVVHADETLQVKIGRASSYGFAAAWERAGAIAARVEAGELSEADANKIDADFSGSLFATYTEIDGYGEQTVELPVDLITYRPYWSRSDFTYEVVNR